MGSRIHRNTSCEPLTTFLRRTMGRWARGQKVKSRKVKINTEGCDNFTYTWTHPRWTYKNQIWNERSRRWCNRLFQILLKSVKEFPSCEGPNISTTVLPVILLLWLLLHCCRKHRRFNLQLLNALQLCNASALGQHYTTSLH